MEDRFNIVTDLEQTGTSIFGIFDGHGGEVIKYVHLIRADFIFMLETWRIQEGIYMDWRFFSVDQKLFYMCNYLNDY